MEAPLDSEGWQNDNEFADEIAEAVFSDIKADGFESPAVDALLHITKKEDGQADVLADVLVYLAKQGHPDWAAEICRMATGQGKRNQTPDYTAVSSAFAHMVENGQLEWAHKVAQFILVLKDNGHGGTYFDCYDLGMVLGNMVKAGDATQAGQVLYAFYCDESEQGHIYQDQVYCLLGLLLDQGQAAWAVELSKQLMYADGEQSIDYSAMGWALAQMVLWGHAHWAAAICESLRSQGLSWYNQGNMLAAIAQHSDDSCVQAVLGHMSRPPAGPPGGGRHGPGGGWGRGAGPAPYPHHQYHGQQHQYHRQGGYAGGHQGGHYGPPRGGGGGGGYHRPGSGRGAPAPPPPAGATAPAPPAAAGGDAAVNDVATGISKLGISGGAAKAGGGGLSAVVNAAPFVPASQRAGNTAPAAAPASGQ